MPIHVVRFHIDLCALRFWLLILLYLSSFRLPLVQRVRDDLLRAHPFLYWVNALHGAINDSIILSHPNILLSAS
jgi:hypothetical protein